ncbi:MAG TPA: PRC-barrel domain-containing protein [Solirubrobacterales bacterium]|nr:PRC-barrel domain-containing protein [Solirubrobacterales bacterium]
MIEPRRARGPTLDEARGWLGFRVDDIYGGSIGKLEDILVDTHGQPRWLLIREGRFAGRHRHTLIPFEDATAGVGHVWVPYEREVVRNAPDAAPGAQLTEQREAHFREHYQLQGSVA